nr:leucine-rich repeat domain-containing protein [Prevotella sp.]
MSVFADDLITQQIVINVDKAGTLSSRISSSKKYKITNLKLTGELNGTDILFIREMAKAPSTPLGYINLDDLGVLTSLDLENVKIVEGGVPYFYYDSDYKSGCYTRNDRIGDYMFYRCEGIKELKLPSEIWGIGNFAVCSCNGLTNLVVPSQVNIIGSYAFSLCGNLEKISMSSNVTSIGKCAFYLCSSLENLTIPPCVTSIREGTFEQSGLRWLEIPTGVTYIEANAFSECWSLSTLRIPSSVRYIGEKAFSDCISLSDVTIPSNVTSICDSTFLNCYSLSKLTLPSSVTSVGVRAFSNCLNLKNLTIPSNVISIGEKAFQNCSGLSSIYAQMINPRNISSDVFDGIDKQKCTLYVPNGTYQNYWLTDGWSDFENIVEYDVAGINDATTLSEARELSRYSVNGQRLTAPTKGVNIVKYSDGSVRKEIVK